MTNPLGPDSWLYKKEVTPKEVHEFHRNADTDKLGGIHHTIGDGRFQSASGEHDHRNKGRPLLDDVTFTGSRGTNTALVMKQIIDALVLLGAHDQTTT